MQVSMLVDNGKVVAIVRFDGKAVTTQALNKDGELQLKYIMNRPTLVHDEARNERKVTAQNDPAEWFANLPHAYAGTYFHASLIEDLPEDKIADMPQAQ